MSETGRNPLEDIVESLSSSVESAWSFIASPETTSNLHSLPSNIQHSVSAFYSDVYNKLTQGGTLPTLPEWSDIPSPWAQQPQPPTIRTPPPSPPSTAVVVWNKLYSTVDNNRLLFAVITTTSSLGATYYFFPATFKTRILPIFSPLIPIKLLPTPNRPLKATSATGEEFRKEAVLVLGASGVTAELALDLERRGFVVIATVASPAEVDRLEKKSRGWMKVLVLDPVDSSSVAPFLRSLSTALSLRFPLHTSGDPFSRPVHALTLTTIVNALPVHPAQDGLRPLEATEAADVRRAVGDKLSTMVAVLAGVIPILRSGAGRPGAPQGVLLSLVPATTSSLSLPFLSLASAFSAGTLSLLDSLRRELAVSESSSNLRLVTLQTGFFQTPLSSTSISPSASIQTEAIPVRLSSIYAGALARRQYVASTGNASDGGRPRGRKGSPGRVLSKKVWEVVVYGRVGVGSGVGAGALTYHLASFLPTRLVDAYLSIQDRLITLAVAHRRLHHHQPRTATSRPLPSPPVIPSPPVLHPPVLRPGYVLPPSGEEAAELKRKQEEQDEEDEENSSVEDFGYGAASGMGSFVGVERP